MSGTLFEALDQMYANIMGMEGYWCPPDWWPIFALIIGLICGVLLAAVLIPWRWWSR